MEKWEEAEKDADKALSLGGANARKLDRRAQARFRLNNYEEALEDFEKAKQIDIKTKNVDKNIDICKDKIKEKRKKVTETNEEYLTNSPLRPTGSPSKNSDSIPSETPSKGTTKNSPGTPIKSQSRSPNRNQSKNQDTKPPRSPIETSGNTFKESNKASPDKLLEYNALNETASLGFKDEGKEETVQRSPSGKEIDNFPDTSKTQEFNKSSLEKETDEELRLDIEDRKEELERRLQKRIDAEAEEEIRELLREQILEKERGFLEKDKALFREMVEKYENREKRGRFIALSYYSDSEVGIFILK